MKSSPASLRRRTHVGHLKAYRPVIELLERRLPPGSMFTNLLFGGSTLALEIDEDKFDAAVSALRVTEKAEISRETLTPSRVATRAAADSVALEPVQRPAEMRPDLANVGTNSPRSRVAPYRIAMNIATVAGIQSGALTAPAQRAVTLSVMPGTVHLNAPNVAAGDSAGPTPKTQAPSEAQKSEILDNYGKMPLSFEQNVGQFDDEVDFVSRAGGSTLFLTPTAAVFSIQNSESRIQNPVSEPEALATRLGPAPVADASGSDRGVGVAVHMNIVGSNPDAQSSAVDQLPGKTNYFIGNDPTQWHTNIASFGRVEYDDVYPGIDLAYYGNNGQLEYDFIVSPGADPSAIALNFAGADGMEINPQGDLVVHTAAGDVVQQNPFTYQKIDDARQEIPSKYVIQGNSVHFQIGHYDLRQPVVIDPVMGFGYSTLLGGGGDEIVPAIAVDASGNAYLTGGASSTFPTTPGAFDTTYNGLTYDVFVAKLNQTGTALAYSTFLGGNGDDAGFGIALDNSANAFITGISCSPNFPTINGNWDTGNLYCDAIVTKLNATGSALAYSTFLGGSNLDYEYGYGIALDSSGNAYVTGFTEATDFPTTAGAFDTTYNGGDQDAFVTKLNASGSNLVYSTYLGGTHYDNGGSIALDGNGNAYVIGVTDSTNFPTTPGAFDTTHNGNIDVFVTKVNTSGSGLVYSTFLGGTNTDTGGSISLDGTGNAYVSGQTFSTNFPTTPGAFDMTHNGGSDVFVTKVSAGGSALVYSTFLGGANSEYGGALALDGSGNAHLTGSTSSNNFPTTPGAFETIGVPVDDAFVIKLNAGGSALNYATLLSSGGSDAGNGLALDAGGNVYVTGTTWSSNFPTTPGAFDATYNGGFADVFVTKLRVLPRGGLTFDPHTINAGTANSPNTVFAADLDGDGDTDALSASSYDAKIAWYKNDGSENFTSHVITTTADQTFSVTAADVDSDGDADVLFASASDHKVSWWANNGSGSFTEQPLGYVLPGAMDVFAADIDSDGDTDILGAGDEVVWYENNGSEVFSRRVITTSTARVQSVLAEDVDQDGDIDVLTASPSDNKIAWYENNGSETFTAQTISPSASGARSVHAGDLDGDGDIDVLSASVNDDTIGWYENNGSESFTARTITIAANGALSVFSADLDSDGDLDVMSASQLDDKIAWYENTGNGSFGARTITTAADGAFGVFAADVDGDSDLDILSASALDDKLAWYENRRLALTDPGQSDPGNPPITPLP